MGQGTCQRLSRRGDPNKAENDLAAPTDLGEDLGPHDLGKHSLGCVYRRS
jgi:hypothetical protein